MPINIFSFSQYFSVSDDILLNWPFDADIPRHVNWESAVNFLDWIIRRVRTEAEGEHEGRW